jgi:metal-responsive CopG/Arc/MetJ family transcriptional regulator
MKIIQMTIDESLLSRVDQTVEDLNITRSAFIRQALEAALRQYAVRRLEERDEAGYQVTPATGIGAEAWAREQEWGDSWNAAK